MTLKINLCKKTEYYIIEDIEKSLFDTPLTIQDLETLSLQNAFKIWKLYLECVIGYVCFFQVNDEVEIIKIGIIKSHQGKSYGSYLIKNIKKLPIKKIFLEVSCLNKMAIKFYMKNGFQKIGIRKNYYISRNKSKADALMLAYKL